jgi:hypothetical protein
MMPLSSDSFDDDDLFDDPAALDAIAAVEAQAISASQATKPHATQGYHHTVSLPRVGSSKPVPPPAFGVTSKGKARDPVPINTEPRVSTGGFGWGDGGKHFFPGNMERIITAGKQQRFREGYDDDDLPEIMMDDSGRYGFLGGAEEEVVDNHARAVSESLAAKAPIARPVGDTSAVATAVQQGMMQCPSCRDQSPPTRKGRPLPINRAHPLPRYNNSHFKRDHLGSEHQDLFRALCLPVHISLLVPLPRHPLPVSSRFSPSPSRLRMGTVQLRKDHPRHKAQQPGERYSNWTRKGEREKT